CATLSSSTTGRAVGEFTDSCSGKACDLREKRGGNLDAGRSSSHGERATARPGQPDVRLPFHLRNEKLDPIEKRGATGIRIRIEDEKGLAQARPVAFVDEE